MKTFSNYSSKKVIFSGFAIVLVLFAVLTSVWLQSLFRNSDQLQTITDQLIDTQHVFAMRDAAYQRAIILYRMATSDDPFDRNDEYMQFKQLANKFIAAREKFGINDKNDVQNPIWERARPMININAQLQSDTAELILEERIDEAHVKLLEQVKPVQDVVMSELTHLFENERINAVSKLEEVKKQNRITYIIIGVLSAVVFVLGAFIAWIVARRANESEEKLVDHTHRIRALYALSGNANLSFEEQIEATLKLGCEMFDMEIAKVCKIDLVENTNTFLHTVAPNDYNVLPGTKIPLDKTFCSIVFKSGGPIALHHVHKSKYNKHPCYEFSHLESYIASPIYINGKKFGTVNFSSRQPKKHPFPESDRDLINLVGNWVSVAMERQYVQSELEFAKESAEIASRAKTGFLANMSHEIRTPLTAMLGFSESLLDPDLNAIEQERAITSIIRSGQHLHQIINDVLDLSKIEAEQLEIENLKESIFVIMADVDAVAGRRARDKGLNFDIEFNFPLPKYFYTDKTRLIQILINICGNAIKFTEDGGITINVKYLPESGQYKFIVTDTGIGMNEEEISRIFKAFSQADTSTTRKYGGTGLGLCISQQLAQKLGGEIQCESEKGRGSQFTVSINSGLENDVEFVYEIDYSQFNSKLIASQSTLNPGELHGKVLVAEDSPDNQQLISMYIRKTGAQVTLAENGKIAVNYAMSEEFDLIFMDMQMPVMGGLEATQWLRQIGCKTPIVALTANAMKEDRERYLAAGADDYLTKPIDLVKFYAAMRNYLSPNQTENNAVIEREGHEIYIGDQLNEDPEYQQLVRNFINSLPDMVKKISDAAQQQDWDTLARLSHDLKGSGGNFGFPELTVLAKSINDASKRAFYDHMDTMVCELNELCVSLLENKKQSRRA